MQNKVSYVVIIILAFVCLVLSMRIGRDGGLRKRLRNRRKNFAVA